jgi:hypothetical protein
VLDSICLFDPSHEDNDLPPISYLTGGLLLNLKSMRHVVDICASKPFLSQLERPKVRRPYMSANETLE